MAITLNDIKIYKSEYMTDTSNGGGNMTNQTVDCGAIANIHPNISREDRLNGNISLMKLFLRVLTENTDVYSGVHMIIYQTTEDTNVNFFIMPYNINTRAEAISYLESFIVEEATPVHPMWKIGVIKAKDTSLAIKVEYQKYNFVQEQQEVTMAYTLDQTLPGACSFATHPEYSTELYKFADPASTPVYDTVTAIDVIGRLYAQRVYAGSTYTTKLYKKTLTPSNPSQNLTKVNGKTGRWEKSPDSFNYNTNVQIGDIWCFFEYNNGAVTNKQFMQIYDIKETSYTLAESEYSKEYQVYKTFTFVSPFISSYDGYPGTVAIKTKKNTQDFKIYGSLLVNNAQQGNFLLPIVSYKNRILPAIPIVEDLFTSSTLPISYTQRYLYNKNAMGETTINGITFNALSETVFEDIEYSAFESSFNFNLKYKDITENSVKIFFVDADKEIAISDNDGVLYSQAACSGSINYNTGAVAITFTEPVNLAGQILIQYKTFGFFKTIENFYVDMEFVETGKYEIDFKATEIVASSIRGTLINNGVYFDLLNEKENLYLKKSGLSWTEGSLTTYGDNGGHPPINGVYGYNKILHYGPRYLQVSNDYGKTFTNILTLGYTVSQDYVPRVAINNTNGVSLFVHPTTHKLWRSADFTTYTETVNLAPKGVFTGIKYIDNVLQDCFFKVGTDYSIGYSVDGLSWQYHSNSGRTDVACIGTDNQGNVYIGCDNGQILYNGGPKPSTLSARVRFIKALPDDKVVVVDNNKNIMVLKYGVIISNGSPFSSLTNEMAGFDVDPDGNAAITFSKIASLGSRIFTCNTGDYCTFSKWTLEKSYEVAGLGFCYVAYTKQNWAAIAYADMSQFKPVYSQETRTEDKNIVGTVNLSTGKGFINLENIIVEPQITSCVCKDTNLKFFLPYPESTFISFDYTDNTKTIDNTKVSDFSFATHGKYNVVTLTKGINITTLAIYIVNNAVVTAEACSAKIKTYFKPKSLNINTSCFPIDGLIPVINTGDRIVIKQDLIESENICNSVNDNYLQVVNNITEDTFATGATICASTSMGDLQAKVTLTPFDQNSWDGVTWSDTLQGTAATATYDFANYPIVLTNAGCETERWALKVTNASPLTIQVIGEKRGILDSVDVSSVNIAIANVNTVNPYFTIDKDGFGAGWQVGNVIRFNTEAAGFPFWVGRIVNAASSDFDEIEAVLEIKGDVE